MRLSDSYVRTGDTRPRTASSYVSDFDAWPEKTPAAVPAQRDRAVNLRTWPERAAGRDASRERASA